MPVTVLEDNGCPILPSWCASESADNSDSGHLKAKAYVAVNATAGYGDMSQSGKDENAVSLVLSNAFALPSDFPAVPRKFGTVLYISDFQFEPESEPPSPARNSISFAAASSDDEPTPRNPFDFTGLMLRGRTDADGTRRSAEPISPNSEDLFSSASTLTLGQAIEEGVEEVEDPNYPGFDIYCDADN